MNRFEREAADALVWHERQARHRQGYAPRPMLPMGPPQRFKITEQERQEREQQIAAGTIPF